jgi:hypothetical protein
MDSFRQHRGTAGEEARYKLRTCNNQICGDSGRNRSRGVWHGSAGTLYAQHAAPLLVSAHFEAARRLRRFFRWITLMSGRGRTHRPSRLRIDGNESAARRLRPRCLKRRQLRRSDTARSPQVATREARIENRSFEFARRNVEELNGRAESNAKLLRNFRTAGALWPVTA